MIKERVKGIAEALRPRLLQFMEESRVRINRWAADRAHRKRMKIAGAVLLAILFAWSSVYRIREGEVGVFVNHITGSVKVEERVGFGFRIPRLYSFYRLDRRLQAITMAAQSGPGFSGGDAVRIKTSDGSNVSLDIQATFRLVPAEAAQVLRTAGRGMQFADLWIRSSVRSAVAEHFGKLSTDQIYNAALRTQRATEVVDSLNDRFMPKGIEMVTVVPQDFRFYREYEEIIKQKKLADQEVEEQQAQARLAAEEQHKQVSAAEIAAQANIANTRGSADRIKAEADGYLNKTKIDAEANLIKVENQAEGLLAIGMAEAEGFRNAARAMSGGGGQNLVALEYARQLANIQFEGVPVLEEGRVGQYRIHSAPANTTGGGQ